MGNKYDFSGYATRNDLTCGDGRIIRKNAFKNCDGETVPIFWNHQHNNMKNVLGHALLENRDDGVYAYCSFNDTEDGQLGKELVQHGDIRSLSIYANNLKQAGNNVIHGIIRELSLVPAGANPGAYVDFVMGHGDDSEETLSGVDACYDENIMIHGDPLPTKDEKGETKVPKQEGKTIKDVIDSMTDEQRDVMSYLVGEALGENGDDDDDDEGGDNGMKHNVFENDEYTGNYLSHADEEAIINLAKSSSCGSFQAALQAYTDDNLELAHGFESYEELFPEFKLTNPGAPEMITNDETWVDAVLAKVHKSPISRIRTRHADVRAEDIRAMGYEKTKEKKLIGQMKLINRTTDPQTVYVKDKLERDDIIDITDFDVVAYQQRVMRMALNEELAKAILIGDGREDGDEGKIQETHIRPIWTDEELYTIHADVDFDAAREKLQGTDTGVHFGDNYVYAEAIIEAALYAREKYKGKGGLDFYCTPHLLNIMLLARDLNGRRIYNSQADLAAALNVGAIHTVEQFEGKTRVTDDTKPKTKKLLGLFVNLSDYQVGSTKGGQITNFEDFDIDFNQYKYLMETRLSGAMTKVFSAIALEEDVTVEE